MIDERNTTWKVLLPHHQNSRTLALGLQASQLISLARTWTRIDHNTSLDTLEPNDIPTQLSNRLVKLTKGIPQLKRSYDLIILGKLSLVEHDEFAKAHTSLLKADSVLIFTDTCPTALHFKDYIISEYGVLPPEIPRIFYPISNCNTRNKGLHFHTPGTLHARVAIRLATMLSNIGFTRHLKTNCITIITKGKIEKSAYLLDWLSEQLQLVVNDIILYCGSNSIQRKVTGLILLENHPDLVVKIADTEEGKNAILSESIALQNISNSTMCNTYVPKLLLEKEWNGYLVQIQSCLPRDNKSQSTELTEQHFSCLSSLTKLDSSLLQFSQTTYFRQIKQYCEQKEIKVPKEIERIIKKLFSSNFQKRTFLCHRVHGDFAPWNIALQANKLLLWDWEDSISDGLVFTDIFHFIIRQAILLGPWHGAKTIIQDINTACLTLKKRATLPEDVNIDLSLQIWLTLEYLRNPHPKLLEISTILEVEHG